MSPCCEGHGVHYPYLYLTLDAWDEGALRAKATLVRAAGPLDWELSMTARGLPDVCVHGA